MQRDSMGLLEDSLSLSLGSQSPPRVIHTEDDKVSWNTNLFTAFVGGDNNKEDYIRGWFVFFLKKNQ